jgi:hypothetical protein
MKTKTIATLAVVGIVGYLILRKSKPAGVGDDLLVPSEGRTVTAGGAVLNGLGMEQSYDAAPYQYRRRALNDMRLDGFGSSFKKAVSKVKNKVKKNTVSTAKSAVHLVTNPKATLKKGVKNIVQIPKKTAIATVGLVFKPRAEAQAGTAVEYQDENGNVITKAQYDAMMSQYAAQNRADAAAKKAAKQDLAIQKQINALLAQRLKIVNSIPVYKAPLPSKGIQPAPMSAEQLSFARSMFNQKNAKVINQKKAQIAAIDKKIQALVNKLSTTVAAAVVTNVQTSTNVQDTAVVNQTGTNTTTPTITYTPEQAAAEEASMTAASDDSGYGNTSVYTPTSSGSSSSTYSAEQAAAEEASIRDPDQASAMPENVVSVETPSAEVLPEEMIMVEEPKKTSGLVVGGGILAAIAAGFALTR